MGYANRKVSCSSSLAVTTTLRSLSYFVRRIPKSSGNVLCLRLSRISYVICISYVISIVVISRSALNVLCLLLYPRNHWQHHVTKVKSSSCSIWIKTLLRLILLTVRWLHWGTLFTSSVQYDKILLTVALYDEFNACPFSQSEMENYFEWIIIWVICLRHCFLITRNWSFPCNRITFQKYYQRLPEI